MNSRVHLAGLNGLRAIAALAVVFSHIELGLESFGLPKGKSLDLAGFGVTIFFSLSGFLITYLLIIEKNKSGNINVKNFYIRRILRIWPLYFFYFFMALICAFLYQKNISATSLVFYLLLSANIPYVFYTPLPFLDHYWSLGVEEQFYLFWPWIVSKSKNILRTLVLFISAFLIARFLFRILDSATDFHKPYLLAHVSRFDCMAIGALGAVLFHSGNKLLLTLACSVITQAVCWVTITLMALNRFHIASVIDHEIIAVLTILLIINVSSNKKSILNLNTRPFDFLGKISFGIYVYHPLILFLLSKIFSSFNNFLSPFSIQLLVYSGVPAATVIIAYISYEVFEKRFLSIKEKYSTVNSASFNYAFNKKNNQV